MLLAFSRVMCYDDGRLDVLELPAILRKAGQEEHNDMDRTDHAVAE